MVILFRMNINSYELPILLAELVDVPSCGTLKRPRRTSGAPRPTHGVGDLRPRQRFDFRAWLCVDCSASVGGAHRRA